MKAKTATKSMTSKLVRVVGKAKPQPAAKPKTVTKTVKKTPAKVLTNGKKTAPAQTGKSAGKPAGKVVAKALPKAVVKAAPKVTTKTTAKAAAPAKALKAAKPVKPVKPVKAVAVPRQSKKPASTAVAKDKSAARGKEQPKVAAAALPALVVAPPVSEDHALALPVRTGRPSSRLAQLTVPSMAQSVASTAAKSSFGQATTTALIVPPLVSPVKKNPRLANNWKSKALELLTDEDVIAMPDAEYMNETQMKFFRLKLLNLKREILSNAGLTTEHLRSDTVVVPDPADRATIEEEHALELRTRDRERKLLKKIEQSIVRIDAGDYGYCDETGEPIGVARLIARPTANLSLEAQQRRELKQKMFGD